MSRNTGTVGNHQRLVVQDRKMTCSAPGLEECLTQVQTERWVAGEQFRRKGA